MSTQMFRYDLTISFCAYIYQESLSSEALVTHILACGKSNWENTVRYCHDRLSDGGKFIFQSYLAPIILPCFALK